MRPAPVQLEHYHLTHLAIDPVEGYQNDLSAGLYPKFTNAEFSIGFKFGDAEQSGSQRSYLVHLDLNAQPKEGLDFPYRFTISADAIVTIRDTDDDETTRRQLVAVNGASLLYSALREMLYSLSFRFPNGPMMLPSASFLDLKERLLGAKVE